MLALRLPDDGEIEASSDAGEQRGGAAEGCVEGLGLPGNARFFHRRFELADGVSRGFAVFLALQLDELYRNTAEGAVGNDRLVKEGDTRDPRVKRAGYGCGVISHEILLAAARQADNDILDHVTTSSWTQRTWRPMVGPRHAQIQRVRIPIIYSP